MGGIGSRIGVTSGSRADQLRAIDERVASLQAQAAASAETLGQVEARGADTQAVVVDTRHAVQDVHTTLAHAQGAIGELRRVADETRALVSAIATRTDNSPLTMLHQVLQRVERYQPIYGLTDDEAVQRPSHDRARLIEKALGDLRGIRLLDLGSSLGFFPMYAADRGARAEGWDFKGDNITASRLAALVTGNAATFHERTIDLENVRAIRSGDHDVVLALSVLHHIVALYGLEYTQELVRELLARVPVLVLELAAKGEDPSLPWDASQPDDPMDVLALVRDEVEIEDLGSFGTHLSQTQRPLLLVRRTESVRVGAMIVAAEERLTEPYPDAAIGEARASRRYFIGSDVLVKQYLLGVDDGVNWRQILAELYALTVVLPDAHVFRAPELVAHELDSHHARLAVRRVPGELIASAAPLSATVVERVARDVLETLAGLHAAGLQHNDVRSWNIIVNDDGGWLIDYGLVAPMSNDDDILGLLWALWAALTGQREQSAGAADRGLPPAEAFGNGKLARLFAASAEGERDAGALLAVLSG